MLKELKSDEKSLIDKACELKKLLDRENFDVDKLNKKNLFSLFYSLTGQLKDRKEKSKEKQNRLGELSTTEYEEKNISEITHSRRNNPSDGLGWHLATNDAKIDWDWIEPLGVPVWLRSFVAVEATLRTWADEGWGSGGWWAASPDSEGTAAFLRLRVWMI